VTSDLERRIVGFFDRVQDPEVSAVYLFGSQARGDARSDSDVDLGILYRVAPPHTFAAQPYALEGELEGQLGRPVQVIVLNQAPVDLRIRVLRDGRLLVDRDRSTRIRFEVETRREWFDFEPILKQYRAPR
jgi:uncharacterized protein